MQMQCRVYMRIGNGRARAHTPNDKCMRFENCNMYLAISSTTMDFHEFMHEICLELMAALRSAWVRTVRSLAPLPLSLFFALPSSLASILIAIFRTELSKEKRQAFLGGRRCWAHKRNEWLWIKTKNRNNSCRPRTNNGRAQLNALPLDGTLIRAIRFVCSRWLADLPSLQVRFAFRWLRCW